MESSRRSFLKIAGISALGLGAKPVLDVMASSGEAAKPKTMRNPKALLAKRWGMVIDSRKLKTEEDLKPLIDICNKIHNIPHFDNPHHEIKWIWSEEFENDFPMQEASFLDDRLKNMPFLTLCNHCNKPPCVRVCPTKATFKRDDGIVMMDYHRCIGCRFCMAACPYGSRSFNFRDPRPFIKKLYTKYPTRTKGVVEKCDFCAERLAVGEMPACVEVSKGALAFGDLDDPNSQVRKLLRDNYTIRRKPALGTGPSVFYIV